MRLYPYSFICLFMRDANTFFVFVIWAFHGWHLHSERSAVFYIPCVFLLRIALLESRLSVWLLGWNAQACKRAVNSHLELRWNFKETIIHEDSLSPALFPKSVSVCSIRSPCADQRHVPPTVLCKQMKGLYWTVYECKFESWGDLRF